MTKTAREILDGVVIKVDTAQEGELLKPIIDQALKELEAIMQTLVIDYENPLLAGHLSNDRKIERNLLRAEQRQALREVIYGR